MAAPRVMTGKAFKFEGVKEMQHLFNEFALKFGPDEKGEFRERIKDILMKPAEVIRDRAKDLAPQGRTGKLRKAIKAERLPPNEAGVRVYVATRSKDGGVFYARFVEKGTSKMAAKPFFRPAIRASRPIIAPMIAEGLKPLIEGMANKLAYHPK